MSMPKVSPNHKASPTHRTGSLGSTPTVERHARRTINANTVPEEEEEKDEARRATEERTETVRRMMQNGTRMQAIMQQEIERLSLQKRDVVMKDRVVGQYLQ